MKLHVFDVEHGACALLIDDFGKKIMIDCGHNASTSWYPGSALSNAGINRIAALFVTNYDEDHVSGIVNLFKKVSVQSIFRNNGVSAAMIKRLKSKDGMGLGIDFLVRTLEESARTGGVLTVANLGLSGVQIQTFCNSPSDFDDENNLSMAIVMTCHGVKFLFTGDLERAGWIKLLTRPDFRAAIAGVEVLFASHHGRESGCCEEVFDFFAPRFVVISDKAKGFQTQETAPWYRQRARGGLVRWTTDTRYVLTTRNDGGFTFEINGSGEYSVKRLVA